MGFHNHLHAKTTEKHKISPSAYLFVAALGLVGMVFTVIGNWKQTKEMYPGYLDGLQNVDFHIPMSCFFSMFSDLCLVLYGFLTEDIFIILYGVINSVVILITMLGIQRLHIQKQAEHVQMVYPHVLDPHAVFH